jgi:hypothetical protein
VDSLLNAIDGWLGEISGRRPDDEANLRAIRRAIETEKQETEYREHLADEADARRY